MRRLGSLGLILMCWPAVVTAESPTIFAQRDVRLAQTTLAQSTLSPMPRPSLPPRDVAPVAPPRAVTLNDPPAHMSLGELTPTPSMWLYEQERRRYEDPRSSVRVNAEMRGAQRRQRLAAMRWFGYSNSRPVHTTTPFNGTPSPQWGSNSADPSVWSGVGGRPTIVLAPESGAYLR